MLARGDLLSGILQDGKEIIECKDKWKRMVF